MEGNSRVWILMSVLLFCSGFRVANCVVDEVLDPKGTIVFSSVGRAHFGFDLYAINLLGVTRRTLEDGSITEDSFEEVKLTDGKSVNYNGHIVDGDESIETLEWLKEEGLSVDDFRRNHSLLLFVSERNGSASLHGTVLGARVHTTKRELSVGEIDDYSGVLGRSVNAYPDEREIRKSITFEETLIGKRLIIAGGPVMQDRPCASGDKIFYTATEKADGTSRHSRTTVCYISVKTQQAHCLTPKGISDYSPALSPSGDWVSVGSFTGEEGWRLGPDDSYLNLYVFKAEDGSRRRLIARGGGWPSWSDDSTIFFHRKADDGWWSIFKITLPKNYLQTGEGQILEERITPAGLDAFTPAASRTEKWIALATHRPGSEYRHVEKYDLTSKTFVKLTEMLNPRKHHYNPFVSANSQIIGYHRCRGNDRESSSHSVTPRLEPLQSPFPDLALLRLDGTFPSFSPDGSLLAFVKDGSVYVTNLKGEGKRRIYSAATFARTQAFATSWDWKRKGVIYTSVGDTFEPEQTPVHVISISNVNKEGEHPWKLLTKPGTGNNAFPSPSPDGKQLVFRSGRSGHKNLYIMNAILGEEGGIRQLTNGNWTDTQCKWSPSGDWIAFSSDRENPGSSSFALYRIRPNGLDLHQVVSIPGRMINHIEFSRDDTSFIFTSNLAGLSAEPISAPFQFESHAAIFTGNFLNASALSSLTYSGYGDGTPAWGPIFISYSNLSSEGDALRCDFDDQSPLLVKTSTSLTLMPQQLIHSPGCPRNQNLMLPFNPLEPRPYHGQ